MTVFCSRHSVTSHLSRLLRIALLAVIMASCLAGQASASLPSSLFGKNEKAEQAAEVALPADDSAIDKMIEKLADRRAQVTAEIARPETPEDRRTLLIELRRLLDQQDTYLRDLKKHRLTVRDRNKETHEWKGFAEKPQNPLAFIEGLRETYYDELLDKQLIEFRVAFTKGLLDDYTKALARARADLRNAEESLRKGKGSPDEAALKSRVEKAGLRVEIDEAGVTTFALHRLMIEEALASKRDYIAFLERKIRTAQEAFPLSKEDLDKKIQALTARVGDIERQIGRVLRNDDTLREELRRTGVALAKARDEDAKASGSSADRRQKIAALQAHYDLLSAKVESIRITIESLRGMRGMIDYEKYVWQQWHALGQKQDIADIDKKRMEMDQSRALIEGWRHYIDTRLEKVFSLINAQRLRIQSRDISEGERATARQLLEVYEQRVTELHEIARHLLYMQQLIQSASSDLKRHQVEASVWTRMRANLQSTLDIGKAIWNAELYVVEDTIIVEGKKISTPRSVTLGKILQALALLVAGLWLARRLVSPLKQTVARRLNLDDNQKDQFGKVLYMALFIAVLIFSFMFARIPLAVFAFLGGALAIGVGFGAQNIINNFISGIILMFDKSIRVGDIVEVEGQGGKVTSIGMRSSHIVRFDGIEMLVPNSQFLQQKVTNWTLTKNQIRFQITVGVAYGTKTDEVVRLLKQAADEHTLVLKEPSPLVIFNDFGDNALIFNLFFWISLGPGVNSNVVSSDLRHRIYDLFDQAGIVLSFPQRDVHLDTVGPLDVRVISAAPSGDRRGEAS